jgi:hypothetical protein
MGIDGTEVGNVAAVRAAAIVVFALSKTTAPSPLANTVPKGTAA